MRRSFLESDHFLDDTLTHLHRADQDQEIKDQLAHIAPHHLYGGSVGVRDLRRGCRERGVDDAGDDDDRTLQTDTRIALQVLPSHAGGPLPGEGRQRDRSQGRVHVQLEEPAVHRQDHHEGQDPDQQGADHGHDPQGNGIEEAALQDLLLDHIRQCDPLSQHVPHVPGDPRYDPLGYGEDGQQDVHAVGHRAFSYGKPEKQLQGLFRSFQFGEVGGGPRHADHEEQDQQRIRNGLHAAVDVGDDAPDGAAAKLLRGGGEQRPYLLHLLRPGREGFQQVFKYPIGSHGSPPIRGAGKSACSPSSLCVRTQPVIRLRISLVKVMTMPPAMVIIPLAR